MANAGTRFPVALALVLLPALAGCGPRRTLVEFGWDEPDTRFLREHIKELQQTPFDGCVFHALFHDPTGQPGNFTWQAWGRRAFTQDDLRDAFADVRALRYGRFRQSFLRLNTTPGDLDWFDDEFQAVLGNAELAARLVAAGRLRGVVLDTEQYQGQLWNYPKQRDAGRRSWGEYASQAFKRGHELMRALQRGDPRITLLLTFGQSLPLRQMEAYGKPIEAVEYGLLMPFVDGLVAGARDGRIIDGHEMSYAYREPERFVQARTLMKDVVPARAAEPGRHRRIVSAGFGLWLDNDWRTQGWSATDPSKNYFTPASFELAVQAALENTDELVWIYSETPRWWSAAGGPVALPAAYADALRHARQQANRHLAR